MMFLKSNQSILPWKMILSSFMVFLILIFLIFFKINQNIQMVFFLISILTGGYYFSIEAFEAIFLKHKITTDVLMVLAYLGAGTLSQFIDAILLIFLYSITETLESVTTQRTRIMIRSLIQLVPKETIVIKNDKEELTIIEDLKLQDIIKIRAGVRIPVDGTIIEGNTYIDESSITGEHLPIYKTVHDSVLAGTIVTDSVIKVRVDNLVQDSTIAKLIHLVEQAQKQKHPLQLLVNRFTRIYNPIIVSIAFLIFSYGIISSNIQFYGDMSASFLVAGAPCALAIGTPVTVIAAIGSAGKHGILAKGGSALEKLAEIEGFAFDKTGTLTFGSIEIIDVIPFSINRDNLLSIANGLESSSNHPFASAVRKYCDANRVKSLNIQNLKVLPGIGIEGSYYGVMYSIGKDTSNNLSINEIISLEDKYHLESNSYSLIFKDKKLIGILIFKDILRDEAKTTISSIQNSGIQVYILTGDKKNIGLEIGKQLGIHDQDIYTNLTPNEKMDIIIELKKNLKLAMLGDGINDAPALAAADLSIAMGVKGSDIAIETADISFMSEDISILLKGIKIAKKMKQVLKQNIIVSTAIILSVLFGVLLGEINLTLAILAHEGSEVLIVGNSLRLLTKVK